MTWFPNDRTVNRQNVFWQTAFGQNVIWQTAIGQYVFRQYVIWQNCKIMYQNKF